MTVGNRIKQRREELGISVIELAERLHKNRATVYRYESDEIEKLPTSILEPLSKALRVTPAYLMGWEDDEINIPSARPTPQIYMCKYYHSVSAGIGTRADDTADTYGYYFSCQSQAEHCFAVDVDGDSMIPKLLDGDIAIVDTEAEPQNGDIVVFYDKSDELGYIKRINRSDNVVMFISDNPSYQPMVYTLSDLNDRVKIEGKVIAKIDNNF